MYCKSFNFWDYKTFKTRHIVSQVTRQCFYSEITSNLKPPLYELENYAYIRQRWVGFAHRRGYMCKRVYLRTALDGNPKCVIDIYQRGDYLFRWQMMILIVIFVIRVTVKFELSLSLVENYQNNIYLKVIFEMCQLSL